MRVVIIGATGYTGTALVQEALARGHQVTAVARQTDKLPKHVRLEAVAADVADVQRVAQVVRGHDAAISAFSGGTSGSDAYERHLRGFESIVAAVKQASVERFLVVGGAGSLEVAPGLQVVDTPTFPSEWKATALAARSALEHLRKEDGLAWTFLSPAAHMEPGPRTGKFRLGGDQLLTDAQGESRISVADFAVAMIDELEQPRHLRQRFSVAY